MSVLKKTVCEQVETVLGLQPGESAQDVLHSCNLRTPHGPPPKPDPQAWSPSPATVLMALLESPLNCAHCITVSRTLLSWLQSVSLPFFGSLLGTSLYGASVE